MKCRCARLARAGLVLAFWITIEEEARYEEIVSFTQASRLDNGGRHIEGGGRGDQGRGVLRTSGPALRVY